MNPIRQKLVDIAKSHIGYVEKPVNLTKFGERFGLNGEPWCMIFQSCNYADAGQSLGPGDYAFGWASVPGFLIKAREKHWVTTEPQPGDLVVIDWGKPQDPNASDWKVDHVEMFIRWIDRHAGTLETVGGNTSPHDKSNGGEVQNPVRNMNIVKAFVNPKNLPA